MKEKIVKYGTRVNVKVLQASKSLIAVAGGEPVEGYLLMGHGVINLPKVDDEGYIIFEKGGPNGGYWNYYPNSKPLNP